MLTQNSFEVTNLDRMHIGATCHKTERCVQSETDLVGMNMVDRPVNDRLFDAVPYTFKPNLKNSGKLVHYRMPVKQMPLRMIRTSPKMTESRTKHSTRTQIWYQG